LRACGVSHFIDGRCFSLVLFPGSGEVVPAIIEYYDRGMLVLVALSMAVVLVLGALGVSDADAKKKPPDYNLVYCGAFDACFGTPSADLILGQSNAETDEETLSGGGGGDIYITNGGNFDEYIDESTSSDLYEGFLNGEFGAAKIDDRGGLDRIDLSTNVSAYASTDVTFLKTDRDGDGAEDDLNINEVNFGGEDDIYVIDHFGIGRIEYIKFTDTTLKGAKLPLS
jgi:hypothetical protein